MINIADLKDPDDPQGRTYREVNNDTKHSFDVMQLVEISNGCRLFVVKQVRDCDGTPLYWLGLRNYDVVIRNLSEDGMKAV